MAKRKRGRTRLIRSPHLTDEERTQLDGAPVFDEPGDALDQAIIGVTTQMGEVVAVYDYHWLVNYFFAQFSQQEQDEGDDPDSVMEGAIEWVDRNLISVLESLSRAPVIAVPQAEDPEADQRDVVRVRGGAWVSVIPLQLSK